MKTKSHYLKLTLVLLTLATLNHQLSTTFAQGTAFSYQGRLNSGSGPASGSYDLAFTLFTTNSGGVAIAGPMTNSVTSVSNGLFTTTIDFGPGVFTGGSNWLEIAVRTNGGGAFSTLSPRQQLTPTPYAIFAENAGTAAAANGVAASAVSAPQLNTLSAPGTGQVLGYNGSQLVWQNPALGGWSLTGNSGTSPGVNFLGTSDNQPLLLEVGGVRALRLEPDGTGSGAPNVIGGSPVNYVSTGIVGAVIAGGGAVNYLGQAYSNSVTASFAAIGGGVNHLASGAESVVGGGYQNTASGYISTVAGGAYNVAQGSEAVVGGGAYNVATNYASVGGGWQNNALDAYSTVAGGNGNRVQSYGTAATIGGGANNFVSFVTFFGSYGGNGSTIAGGLSNSINGDFGTIGGGVNNRTLNYGSAGPTVAGGVNNYAETAGTVSGGSNNHAYGSGVVPGGFANTASGVASFAAGQNATAGNDGSFVWADDSSGSTFADTGANQFRIRATGGVQVVGGGLAVTGASSPNYPGTSGVYLENGGTAGNIFAFNYNTYTTLPLRLNSPGGNVGIGSTVPTHLFQVGNAYCDGNTWAPSSDRNLKAGIRPVDAQAVLAKVAALPITSWHYTNDVATPHVGPMAQDFYAAFNVGADDKHITTTDEGGVALAAIQGLNEKLEGEVKERDAEIQNLEMKLDELQSVVKQLAAQK